MFRLCISFNYTFTQFCKNQNIKLIKSLKRQNKLILLGGGLLAGAAITAKKLKGSSGAQLNRLQMKMKVEPAVIENTRGKIYFELFTAYRIFREIKAGIYNTIKRIPVPVNEWENLDTDKIKKELGAAAIIKNGPRFWVMDELRGYCTGESRVFEGYTYDLVATLSRRSSEISKRENYKEQTINRYTDFIFFKDRKIYELITDKNVVYTLQAASKEIIKDQKPEDLDSLQEKLKLPDGWTFRVRVPADDVIFKIRGEAHVIQDEFRNTYQRNPD